jgi:hypothetical protein
MQVEIHDGSALASGKPPAKPGLHYVDDAQGRRLGVRKIGPLERMRLFKVIGPVNSQNPQYLGYAMLAYSVAEIDGEPSAPPATEPQMEMLVQRLGEDGFDALGRAQMEMMGVTEADMEAAEGDAGKAVQIATARKAAESRAAAKN